VQWINQAHMPRSDLPLRTILARMRHEHCGGRAAKAELLTGTEAAAVRCGGSCCGAATHSAAAATRPWIAVVVFAITLVVERCGCAGWR
jgi:hypothetical protein